MLEATVENQLIVESLLAAAGLHPPPEEVARLAQLYGPIQRQLAMIHAAPVGDVDRATVFRAGQGTQP